MSLLKNVIFLYDRSAQTAEAPTTQVATDVQDIFIQQYYR